ncbi:MAG: ribonuclease III [Alphaproteobacteria bacterium]|nr:ribonuclease III [Alphaproteobacteria bacterium]
MEQLQQILKYRFNDVRLLQQALTHSSVTGNEHRNYERLEFLGDRVLGMTMAHLLFKMFPNDREGVLAQRHVKLVCADMVAKVVQGLGIEPYIQVKDKETLKSTNVLCDIGEAIIGAIYIDSNIENAIRFVERNWRDMIDMETGSEKDFKTQLQERFHALKLPSPVYEVVDKAGSEHEPIFTVKVAKDEKIFAFGHGKNKKLSEQDAAEQLLQIMG